MHELLAAVTVLGVSTAQAGVIYVDVDCSSDCCVAPSSPGCQVPYCEAAVCDFFPSCCDVQWDATCVIVADVVCDPLCTQPPPPDGTQPFPYCSIQTAIDNAANTNEIIVAPGAYFEAIDFLGKAITLHSSDGPDVTIIDGTGNLHVVQCVSGEGPDTRLDGFTITGGNASGSGSAPGGGGMYNAFASPTVTNCIFSGNTAMNGGGMSSLHDCSPLVTNCTFRGNSATNLGGGMHSENSSPTVANCILWGDTPDEIDGDAGLALASSNVQGGFPGPGNIEADPLFADPDNGDLRLSPNSPCIDAGDNTAVPAGISTDLDGNPRFLEVPETPDTGNGVLPIVDMGAYESLGGGCLAVTGQAIVCHADGTTFTVDVEGLNACTGGTTQATFTGSGGAAGEQMCSTVLVGDGGFCCSTEICVTIPDCAPQQSDLNGNGQVGIEDFLALLAAWGDCPDCGSCPADVDGDCTVGIMDLLTLRRTGGRQC